jgi:hypothetical protein
MLPRRFLLKPFPGEGNPADVTVGGSITRSADTLSVRYEVRGNLSMLEIPAAAEAPRRVDRLWEETCLELFLGTADSGEYWEVNLSPSGHWNAYRFTRYREGMREEPAFTSLPFTVRIGPEALELSMELEVGKIIPAGKIIESGVAAVVKTVKGGTNYLALTHPGPRPDFHDPNGFALTLPPAKPSCRTRSRRDDEP